MPDAESLQFVGVFSVGLVVGAGWLLTLYCLWDRFERPKDPRFIHFTKDFLNATAASLVVGATLTIAINVTIWLPALAADLVASVGRDTETAIRRERPIYLDELTGLLTDIQSGVGDLQRREPPQVDVNLEPLRQEVTAVRVSVEGIEESLGGLRVYFVDEIVAAESAEPLTNESFTRIVRRHFSPDYSGRWGLGREARASVC